MTLRWPGRRDANILFKVHLELVPTTDFHRCVCLQIAKGEGLGGLDANYTFLSSYLILFVLFRIVLDSESDDDW